MTAPINLDGTTSRDFRALIAADAEYTPTYTLDRQVAEARSRMGEAEWQRLNEEWDR